MGYYAFGNFWVCQKKITIYSLFGSPCIADATVCTETIIGDEQQFCPVTN